MTDNPTPRSTPTPPLPYARLEIGWTPLEPSWRRAWVVMLIHAIIAAAAPIVLVPAYLPDWDNALDAGETWAVVIALIVFAYLLAALVAWVTMLVFFLLWFATAHGNVVRSAHRTPRHSTGWAVASWFVPVVNLVVPMQALRDTYACSLPDPAGANLRSLYAWWALWLISWVTFISSLAIDLATDSQMPLLVFPIDMMNSACGLIATLMLLKFMRQVTVAHAANERPDVR